MEGLRVRGKRGNMSSTAYLVDKDTVFAHGLKHLLTDNFDIEFLGQSLDLSQASEEIINFAPDLVFIDPGDRVLDCITTLRTFRLRFPNTKLTVFAEAPAPSEAREIGSLGFEACVLKPLTIEVLRTLLEHLERDEVFVSPGFDADPREYSSSIPAGRCGHHLVHKRLSERETQILVRTVNGQSAAEIADEFDISVKTAEWHRRNVYSKLRLKNVAQLTKFALRTGLIALD